ncbi:hypothetical protein [Nonomuraea dietziae]|uniref:hypothetical protein n=1 Tax=Nonomuraea dietziae TaxID=65515 RepID=UPI0033F4046F
MAPVVEQSGWPSPPDQLDQQVQAGPSTGEWAVPPQHPDVFGGPATGPMSANDAFGGPVLSAFGGAPQADAPGSQGGPAPHGEPAGPAPFGGEGGGAESEPTAAYNSPTDRLVATGPPRQPVAAWEEPSDVQETGFLGAGGWDEGPGGWDEEPGEKGSRRRGRRRPPAPPREAASGGRGKVAILSVAAVAIVLGGTVVGVRMVGSSEKTPTAGKVSVTQAPPSISDEPEPEPTDAAEGTEEAPVAGGTEEPSEEPSETRNVRPRPTATASARAPRRTSTPRPTVKNTPRSTAEDDFAPSEEPTASPEPSGMREADNTAPPPVSDVEPGPTATSQVGSGTSSGGAAVNVRFDVVRQRLAGYTAELRVVNESGKALADLTVSVPVDGTVSAVRGAQWSQDGDLLVIQPHADLEAGEAVQITFTSDGTATEPQTCGMVGGECTVA